MAFALFTLRATYISYLVGRAREALVCRSHSAPAVPTTFPYIHPHINHPAVVCAAVGGGAVSAYVLKMGPCGPTFMAHNLTLGPLFGVVWLSVSASAYSHTP